MCGIAGIMTMRGARPADGILRALGDALAHRGPDGRGHYLQGEVGMVQTRLAIIDLATGDQPIHEPGGASLVANGEIYNYVELGEQLRGAGVVFSTGSDCEIPLHLYRRHDLGFTGMLRGMYAIAIHDRTQGRLILARDPFGIKPLYYAETAQGFAFASEAQALIKAGLVAPIMRPQAREELMQLQFTTGRDTIFEGIQRVLPGETLVVGEGRVVARRRQAALPESGPERWDEGEALGRLDEALTDSVRVHQRSDVPYGMFLSGGVDSSCLLALMASLNERPVRAYTAGFSGTSVADERAHARHLAGIVGASHSEIEFGPEDFWTLLPRIAAAMDDPAADYAVLPSWKLAQEARKEVKVILCGEGGDELFAGYGRYRKAIRHPLLGGRPMRGKGNLHGLGILRQELAGWRDGMVAAEAIEAKKGRSRLQAAQAVDCADWLPNDLLVKLDRCLMAHGIEGRTPFLDPKVADVAFRLPDRLKLNKGMGKWLLRKWLDERLSQAQPFARKRGFTVPVAEWIAARGAQLGPLVAAQPGIEELCRPDAVVRLFASGGKRAGFAAWTLLFYALWHRHHILGLQPEGDVFAVLGNG